MKARIKATGEIITLANRTRANEQGVLGGFYWIDEQGTKYPASDLDFLPEKETAVLEGFVARDKSGFISLFSYRPDRITKGNLGFWGRSDGFAEIGLPRDSFPSVTWLSEPKRIRITIETIDE